MNTFSFLKCLRRVGVTCFIIVGLLVSNSDIAVADAVFVVRTRGGTTVYTNKPRSNESILRVINPNSGRLSKVPSSSLYTIKRLSRSHNAHRFHDIIVRQARQKGLDPSLVKAVVHAESSFNPSARSPKGAMGLMQLMPATARSVGVRNPYEPTENIRGGVNYLAKMLRRYKGNVKLSLAAYNAGPLAVDTYRGIPPYRETQEYVRKVLALQRVYQQQSS